MSTRTAGWLWVAGQFTALGVLLFLPWRTPNPLLLNHRPVRTSAGLEEVLCMLHGRQPNAGGGNRAEGVAGSVGQASRLSPS